MAEVLVVGKKISEMDLVTDIVGDEKIPTGVVGDKAVTTGQLLTYLDNNGKVQWGRIEGDIANQTDLQNQFSQQLATLQNHIQDQDNPHNVTKEQVGLGLADNTADMDKPVSTAVQEALSLKADQTYVDDSLANKTHNSLLGRDADGAHPASAIFDGSGVTQQQVNDLTGAPYRVKVGGYNIGERVVLGNGGIVKSTVDGNTVNPNTNMSGWIKTNDASQIELKFNSITESIKKSLSEYVYDIFIDVTWFGAKPDYDFYDKTGTDSTSALQSAIAFVSALGTPRDGGRALIKVPVGSYKATSLSIPQTSTMGFGITIRGDGQSASAIYFDAGTTSPAMTVGIEGLHFEDISLLGYGSIGIPTGRSDGIVAAKATRACDIDIKFSRCHISGWDKFLDINGRGAVFSGCTISLMNLLCNIYVTPDLTFNPSNPLSQGESTSLRHYTFLNNRFDAINHVLSVSGSGNMLQHINDVQFVGNDFAATSTMIYAAQTPNTIVGLQVVGNTGIASFASAPIVASSIKGLVCLGNHAVNNYVYKEIPTINQNCTESLVQCSGDLSDAIVSNNIVRNLRTQLVRVLGNGSNINVTGNILPEAWSFGAAENKVLVQVSGTRSKINIFNNSLTSSNVSGTYSQLNGKRPLDGSVIKDNLGDWAWVDSDVTFSSTIYAGATALTTEVTTNRVRYTFDGDFIVGNLYLAANTDVSQPVLMNLPVPAILDMSNFGSSYSGGVTIHRVLGFSAAGASLIGYVNPATQRFEFKKLINLSESNLQWSDGTGNKTIVGSFRYRYK